MMWKPNTGNKILIYAGQLMIGCQTLRFTFSDIRICHRYLIGWDHLGRCCSCTEVSVPGPWRVSLQPYPASNLSSVGDEDFIKGLLRGNRFSVVDQNPNTFKTNTTMHCVKRRRSGSWALLFHWSCCCCMMRCSGQHNIWSGMNHSAKTGFDETLEGRFSILRTPIET